MLFTQLFLPKQFHGKLLFLVLRHTEHVQFYIIFSGRSHVAMCIEHVHLIIVVFIESES